MKKLVALMVGLMLGVLVCHAEITAETVSNGSQEVDVDMSGIVGIINKQPTSQENKQSVKVRRSGLVVIVNINGKVQAPAKAKD